MTRMSRKSHLRIRVGATTRLQPRRKCMSPPATTTTMTTRLCKEVQLWAIFLLEPKQTMALPV